MFWILYEFITRILTLSLSLFNTESSPVSAARRGGEHRYVVHGLRVQRARPVDRRRKAKDHQLHGGPGAACLARGVHHGAHTEVSAGQAEAFGRPGQDASTCRSWGIG